MINTDQDRFLSHFVLFRLADSGYGIPVEAVERVALMVEVSPLPSAPEVLLGVIDYQGRALPVLDLRVRLGLPRRTPDLSSRLMVVNTPQRTVALAVDEIVGLREVTAGSMLDPSLIDPALRQVAGVVTLDDGLVIIQEIEALLSADEEQEVREALKEGCL